MASITMIIPNTCSGNNLSPNRNIAMMAVAGGPTVLAIAARCAPICRIPSAIIASGITVAKITINKSKIHISCEIIKSPISIRKKICRTDPNAANVIAIRVNILLPILGISLSAINK